MPQDSPRTRPLVENAVPRNAATITETIPTHAPFKVSDDTYIVAVVAGDSETASPFDDGWFQSDFYALNYLLKGIGREQRWLATVDPRLLLNKYGPYLHGNSRRQRRVVLSHELLDAQEISPVEVYKQDQINDRFLGAVSELSTRAKASGGNLLVLAFCHGEHGREQTQTGSRGEWTDVQRLCLTNDKKKGVSLNQLKGAIDHGVRATLVSSACYVGGWLMQPGFYSSEMESRAWQNSASIGRACGSAFVSSMMSALCETEQPRDEPEHSDADQKDMSLPYNQLCRSVLDLCTRTLFEDMDLDFFSFSAQNDGWEESWCENTGIPVAQFKSRWEALEVAQVAIEPESLYFCNKGKHAAHGLPGPSSTDSPNPALKAAVDIFLAKTPASTYSFGGPRIRGFLIGCALSGSPVEETDEDDDEDSFPVSRRMNAWQIIRFRTEFAHVITYFVDEAGLPRPRNEDALEFDDDAWRMGHFARNADYFGPMKEFQRRIGSAVHYKLYDYGSASQGGSFSAMERYVQSSLFAYYRSNENITMDDVHQKWVQIRDGLDEMAGDWIEHARNDKVVKQNRRRYRGISRSA